MTLNIYKIDPTSLEEVIALIGDNPFESIGLTAKVEDHCITYECVKRFETDSQVEEIEDIVMEAFDVIKEYKTRSGQGTRFRGCIFYSHGKT